MSGATYRIDVFRSSLMPDKFPWKAHVIRLSDDEMVAAGVGMIREEAIDMARELIQRMNEVIGPASLYVDDSGQDTPVPAPHSVKV